MTERYCGRRSATCTASAPPSSAARSYRVGSPNTPRLIRVRGPTAEECRGAIRLIDEQARVARAERGINWAFGADELYVRAGVELPQAEIYDGFDQVENGVGSVRWLQQPIGPGGGQLGGWAGKRIAGVTGPAMGQLMPMV